MIHKAGFSLGSKSAEQDQAGELKCSH